ncbi:helix-turn-helix domain-containing protein [Leifsonia sp. McL0607]|uniref:helix-turn-helix domain-containing protein n=1 Tax=Leifsonia sp. McL0607 TaxID=3415672 RepID=UPI003CEF6745
MTEASSRQLGENLRAARQAAGLSQNELAVHSGIHVATVTKAEDGLTSPTVTTLLRLAFALDCKASALLEGVELTAPRPRRR